MMIETAEHRLEVALQEDGCATFSIEYIGRGADCQDFAGFQSIMLSPDETNALIAYLVIEQHGKRMEGLHASL